MVKKRRTVRAGGGRTSHSERKFPCPWVCMNPMCRATFTRVDELDSEHCPSCRKCVGGRQWPKGDEKIAAECRKIMRGEKWLRTRRERETGEMRQGVPRDRWGLVSRQWANREEQRALKRARPERINPLSAEAALDQGGGKSDSGKRGGPSGRDS